MRNYGQEPKFLGYQNIQCNEMMFYQYLPIKLLGNQSLRREERLSVFDDIIGQSCCDYIGEFGLDRYTDSYVYITAKHMYQNSGCSFNREGWHSDGFMTDDINYIWSNNNGFTFNDGVFNLSQDHEKSMVEMEEQADYTFNGRALDFGLYRLDQYVIHKVSEIEFPAMRTFVKISISKDKYNLIGNSVNRLLDYNWDMKQRGESRNHPSK